MEPSIQITQHKASTGRMDRLEKKSLTGKRCHILAYRPFKCLNDISHTDAYMLLLTECATGTAGEQNTIFNISITDADLHEATVFFSGKQSPPNVGNESSQTPPRFHDTSSGVN